MFQETFENKRIFKLIVISFGTILLLGSSEPLQAPEIAETLSNETSTNVQYQSQVPYPQMVAAYPLLTLEQIQQLQESQKKNWLESVPSAEGITAKAVEEAGKWAKSIGQSIGSFIQEKKIESKQRELVAKFYAHFDHETRMMILSPNEYAELLSRVENVYIQDGETGELGLDPENFREMPQIIKKAYSEMLFDRARTGTVDTYDYRGNLATRWKFVEGELHGPATSYYPAGNISHIDIYESGNLLHRKKYDQDGKLEFEQSYEYSMSFPPSEAGNVKMITAASN